MSLAVYPQVELSTAGSVARHTREDGQSLVLPLLVMKEFAHVTTVYNAGLERPVHAADTTTSVELGAGLGRAFFRKLAVMGEVRSSSNVAFSEGLLVSADVGVIYGVRKTIWYASAGHTLLSDDGPHVYFDAGMKVFVETRSRR